MPTAQCDSPLATVAPPIAASRNPNAKRLPRSIHFRRPTSSVDRPDRFQKIRRRQNLAGLTSIARCQSFHQYLAKILAIKPALKKKRFRLNARAAKLMVNHPGNQTFVGDFHGN
jgi:hypothetical protein